MQPVPIWREETQVRPFETDFRNWWKPACFFQTIQETATHHAKNLGFDFADMMAMGTVWVLTRLKIIFYQFPMTGQKVIVETWPKGIQQKIFFTRDFHFYSPTGDRYAAATSAWLLIDPHKRRMLLPNVLPGSLPRNEGHSALDEQLEKINPVERTAERHTATAAYSAIDLMSHVNNARYIEWICDSFPYQHHQNHHLKWLQINYNNEVKPEEWVSIRTASRPEDANQWVIEGVNQNSGVKAFDAETGWIRTDTG